MKTYKSMILDFAEKHESTTWSELHTFALATKKLKNDSNKRGCFSSYFAGHSDYNTNNAKKQKSWKIYGGYNTPTGRKANSHGLLMIPTKKDPRYLEKINGKYIVKIWNKINKLNNN